MTLIAKNIILILVGSVLLSVGVGVIIGYFSASRISNAQKNKLNYYDTLIKEWNPSLLDEIVKETKAENIRENLR